jgi:hypothetical protein
MVTENAKQHFDWCVGESLEMYPIASDPLIEILVFIDKMKGHPETKDIIEKDVFINALVNIGAPEGLIDTIEDFEKFLRNQYKTLT